MPLIESTNSICPFSCAEGMFLVIKLENTFFEESVLVASPCPWAESFCSMEDLLVEDSEGVCSYGGRGGGGVPCRSKCQRRSTVQVDIFIDIESLWSKWLEEGVYRHGGPVRWLEPSVTGRGKIPPITGEFLPTQCMTSPTFFSHWTTLQNQPCLAA